MDYSDSENAISNEWDKLIEHPENMDAYIMKALMISPMDTRKKMADGKIQKCVQVHSISRSIINNANPDKKGLTYLAMRAIHYWKTIYERAIADPEGIEHNKDKFVSKHMHNSITDDFHAEIGKLQDQIYSKKTVTQSVYNESVERERLLQKKYDELMQENENKSKSNQSFYELQLKQRDEKHDKQVSHWKDEMAKMAKMAKMASAQKK